MKQKGKLFWILIFMFIFSACRTGDHKAHKFVSGKVEYTENPVNIDVPNPRFSWIVSSTQRGGKQTAYQILVAESRKYLESGNEYCWNSGKQSGHSTIHHAYKGKKLESNKTYYWKVNVWDAKGHITPSPIYTFHTAFLSTNDWKAEWIGANSAKEPHPEKGFIKDRKEEESLKDTVFHQGRSVLLRNEFSVNKPVKSAWVFVTGLGMYEMMLNGKRVGDFVLSPAKTPYHKYILYDTYDVTSSLLKGRNAVGLHLGNGWYNPYKKWWNEYRMQWFGYKKALMQMHISYKDGTSEIFTTGRDWKTAPGPVLYNCIYDGEIYDANVEITGWSEPGFDDSKWEDAVPMRSPDARLVSQIMPAIKVTETKISVKSEPKPGLLVFDMGQNFAGWVRIAVKGEKGTKIKIRFSEELYEDGTLNYCCNENAKASVEYTLKGGETEYYESKFTYFGFQFVEITGEPELPAIGMVEGKVIHSANKPVGTFECSNELLNKIHRATVWSQRSNMLGYPMDCPQRDERLGWLGDAQVTAEEAMFNFDMAMFYRNWLRGIRLNQNVKNGDIPIISPRPYIKDDGIEWSSSYITIAWNYYKYYGDTLLLKENYPAMKSYMNFLMSISDDYILPQGWIGDWGSLVKGWQEGEPESVPTAFYYYNATILAKMAEILGEMEDKKHFTLLAEDIKNAFNQKFLNSETNNYNDGSQMANAFPVFLGLVPKEHRKDVEANLIYDIVEKNDMHLTTGVLGTKYMMDALSMAGRPDIAWALATQTTYPSWSEMMKRFNTVCEFWTLKQSHNHVMMGSIDAWFYKNLSGINLSEDKPAFETFTIKPFIADGLNYANASIETIRGTVTSEWKRTDHSFELKCSVPFNTSAIVYVPAEKETAVYEGSVQAESAEGVTFLKFMNGYQVFELCSGKYEFTSRLEPGLLGTMNMNYEHE